MIPARRTAVSKIVEKLIAASANRSLSTGALERTHYCAAASWGRAAHTFPFIRDMFYPFAPAQSLSQMLSTMDRMLDSPFFWPMDAGVPRAAAGEFLRGWEVKEDSDALHLSIDMPGLGKEHVKVWAEKNTLFIKGDAEGEKEPEKEGEEAVAGRRHSSRIDLPAESYRMDQIKAEMKNGVLKVVLPKVKQEERNEVNIE